MLSGSSPSRGGPQCAAIGVLHFESGELIASSRQSDTSERRVSCCVAGRAHAVSVWTSGVERPGHKPHVWSEREAVKVALEWS